MASSRARARRSSSSPPRRSPGPRSPTPSPSPSPSPGPLSPSATDGRRVANARHVRLGDVVKIERRYVVDGSLTSVTDEGRFKGVQVLGSTEHLLLEAGDARDVRMIPLHTISEIVIVTTGPGSLGAAEPHDPSFA